MKPWEIAMHIAAQSAGKGRNSDEVTSMREDLNDLIGEKEARDLIAKAQEHLARN